MAALLGLALAVAVVLSGAELVAGFVPLYRPALREAAAAEQDVPPTWRAPLTAVDFERILRGVLAYCNGRTADVQVMLPAAAGAVAGFTADELTHLADVRDIFSAAKTMRNALAAILLLVAGAGALRGRLAGTRLGPPTLVWAAGWTLAMVLTTGLAAALDFSVAFERFHLLLFRNDLWLLPGDSLLITMLPGWLFERLAASIGLVVGLGGFACGILGWRWGRGLKSFGGGHPDCRPAAGPPGGTCGTLS